MPCKGIPAHAYANSLTWNSKSFNFHSRKELTMDIQKWAETLVREVKIKWESIPYCYGFREHGFRVFHSPVYFSPNLMIIGFNPECDKTSLSEERESEIPIDHEYFIHDTLLARRTKYLFEGIERDEWLEKSVKVNMIFFVTPKETPWENLDGNIRVPLELFCFRKVHEIIETLKPRYILTEGLRVFDVLTEFILMGCTKPDVKIGIGGRKIYAKSQYGYSHLIGIVHLAKERLSYPDWNTLKILLKADFKDPDEIRCLH